MTESTWHIHPGILDDYLRGRLDPARVLSVEAHVGRCARCRSAVPADEAWLADGWTEILDTVDRPKLSLVERLLRCLGVPEHRARLLAATPSLRRSWLFALAGVLAFAVIASQLGGGHVLGFLVVAPVLPVLAVAAAYGPRVDPVYEIAAATPTAGPVLLFWRSSAVLVASVVTCGAGAAFLPDPGWLAAAWLLPALALCLAGLALATVVPLQVAAGLLGVLWLVGVTTVVNVTRDQGAAFGPDAQKVYVLAALLAASALFARRRRLDPGAPR